MVTREACAECEQSMGDYGLVIKETEKPQEREEEAGGPGVGPQKPQAGGFLETPSGRGKERGGRHEGCSGESWGDAAGRAWCWRGREDARGCGFCAVAHGEAAFQAHVLSQRSPGVECHILSFSPVTRARILASPGTKFLSARRGPVTHLLQGPWSRACAQGQAAGRPGSFPGDACCWLIHRWDFSACPKNVAGATKLRRTSGESLAF